MNYSMIRYILCRVLEFEALFLSLPCLVGIIYHEKSAVFFAAVMAACFAVSLIGRRFKPKNKVFYAKEGFVTVSLSWIILSLVGAMPFYLSGEIPSYTDALFETVSGLTTTGATILTDVEVLSRSAQFWRCFTHWIGGMGVLVLIMAVLPLSGSYNMHLLRAESPGPKVGKLVPKVKNTAMILYGIYMGITLAGTISLMLAGLSAYDAVTLAFSSVGTGGFGLLNSSAGSYSVAVQAVLTALMLICGVNFQVFYLLLIRKPKEAFASEEIRYYFIIVLLSAVMITLNTENFFDNIFLGFHHALFQVASVITTTGFSSVDYDKWPEFSKTIMFLLSMLGACAGSTSGGFKISRFIISLRSIKNEISYVIHPRGFKKIYMDGHVVESSVTKSVQVYAMIYIFIFFGSFLVLSLNEFDFTTNMAAVAATFNNVGAGFSLVGPSGNYSIFSGLSKFVLIFDMLVGRLELLPILILLSPGTWKK
ncbi:TrkH family potassium uptake protein [Kineothrix sedimenti]|uniref:TrkH family potassium uptake protein n=1 Tax=Kineothrix sedimenti TaxID=3123317 RepID=A0ABZ3ET93_9FIRM